MEERVEDALADDEELPLESILVLAGRAPADKDLPVEGLGRLHGIAEVRIVDRHVAPAQKDLAFLDDDLFGKRANLLALRLILRQEHVADGIMAFRGKFEA